MESKKPEYDAGFIDFIKINKIELDSECLETFYYNLYYDIPIFVNDKILNHFGIQLKINGVPTLTAYDLHYYIGFLPYTLSHMVNGGSMISANTLQICQWNFSGSDYLSLNNDKYIEFKNTIKQKFNLSYDILKMIYPIIVDKSPTNPTLPHILMKQKTFKKFIGIIARHHSEHFLNLYEAMKLYKKHQEKCINNQFIIEESNKKLINTSNAMFIDLNHKLEKNLEKINITGYETCSYINHRIEKNIEKINITGYETCSYINYTVNEEIKNINSTVDEKCKNINNMVDVRTTNIEHKIDVKTKDNEHKFKELENTIDYECKQIEAFAFNIDKKFEDLESKINKKIDAIRSEYKDLDSIDSKIDRINQQLTTEIEIIQINNILTNDSINNMLDINTKNIESKIDETKEIEFMVDEKTKHIDDEKIKHIINKLKIVHNNKKIKEFSNINSTIDEKIKNMFDEEFKKMENMFDERCEKLENMIDYECKQIEAFAFNIDKKFEDLESKINKKIDAIRSEYKDLDSIESKIAEKTKDIEFNEKNVYDNYENANDEYEKLFESYKQISEHHITINIKNDNIADLFNTVRKNWESHEEKVSKVFSVDYMNNKEFHNAYEERKNAYIIYKDVKLEFQKSTDELNKSNNMQACLYEKLNNADENRKKSYILYKNAISVSEPPPYN